MGTQTQDELTYEELKLNGFAYSTSIGRIGEVDLDVTDAIKAIPLSGLSGIIVGHSEKGKSFSAKLMNRMYFGGQGILVQGQSMEENTELLTQIFKRMVKERAEIVVEEELLKLPFWIVEEFGAIPKPLQSSFYSVGDGIFTHKGKEIPIGFPFGDNQRYFSMVATTNTLGNNDGDYGNFGITRAAASRFHVCVDMRHYRRNIKDLVEIVSEDEINPRHNTSIDTKTLLPKIVQVHQKILNPDSSSLEELAAICTITNGTANCIKDSPHMKTEERWFNDCPDCTHKQKCASKYFDASEKMRTAKSTRAFARALAYIAKLKKPDAKVYMDDAVFTAAKFTLAGKFGVVNPVVLAQDYKGNEGAMIEAGLAELKTEYEAKRKYILKALEEARNGKKVSRFVQIGDEFGAYQEGIQMPIKAKIFEPFVDTSYLGFGWVNTLVEKIADKSQEAKWHHK